MLSIRGEGMPALRGRGAGRPPRRRQRRDPAALKREQRELLEQLAGSLTDDNLRTDEGVFGKLRRAFGAGDPSRDPGRGASEAELVLAELL